MAGGEAEPLLGRRRGGGAPLWGGARGAGGLAVVVLAVLVGDANRGLLIPSLQPYLGRFGGSAFEVGACNAAFSLGRLLAAPLYGLWMDRRSPGEPLLAALALAGLANMLYTYAGPLGGGGTGSIAAVFASRCVCGVGASVLGVGRGYIGKETSRAARAPYIALLCAAQYAGFTLSALVSTFAFPRVAWLGVDKLNTPGLILVGLHVLAALVLLLVPSNLFRREASRGGTPAPPLGAAPAGVKLQLKVPGIVGVFVFLNFAVRAVLATLETLATPIIAFLITGSVSPRDWTHSTAIKSVANLFAVLGAVGLANFAALFFVARRVPARVLLASGLVLTLLGTGCMLDPFDGRGPGLEISLPRFEAGLGIAWALGYPISQTVVVSALSKVLTRDQQGLWMGYLAAAGSAGRIAAPLLAGFLYTKLKSHTGFVPVVLCLATTLLACILVAAFWARLREERGGDEEEDGEGAHDDETERCP